MRDKSKGGRFCGGCGEDPEDCRCGHKRGFNKRVAAWIDENYDGNVLAASRATKITRNTLHLIYRGHTRTPSASVLVKLSSAMGCSIDFLLTGKTGNGNKD